MSIISERLSNQCLTKPMDNAEAVVRHLGAMQSQDYYGAAWAIALRLRNTSKVDIDELFNSGKILRTHVMRPTWHFVLPEDIRWMLKLTAPRISQAMAYYNRKLELDSAFFTRTQKIIAAALKNGNFLTRKEIAAELAGHGIKIEGQRLGHVMMQAEIDGLICSGPFRSKQFTYALIDERAPNAKDLSREESLATLASRYFASHGPALLKDFTWWSGLTATDSKHALELIKPQLQSEKVGELEYWFVPGHTNKQKIPKMLLLSVYDEYVIAYKDYSPVFPDEVKYLTNIFGNATLQHVIVKNGHVIGGWQREIKPGGIAIKLQTNAKLSPEDKNLVAEAAKKYGRFWNLPISLNPKN